MLYLFFLVLWALADAKKCADNCWSWNDGCNTCTCDVFGRIEKCTERHCLQQGDPYCEKLFKPAKDSMLSVHVIGKKTLHVNKQDKTYVDMGAKCIDNNDIYYNVHVTGDVVNLNKIGTYTIEYLCMANGYKASSKRTVQVSEGVACTKDYTPVCCNAKTYSNICMADSDACFKSNKGECPGSTDCFGKANKKDADWCCTHHNLMCPKPCIMIRCASGYDLVGTDDRGCGGSCIRRSSGTDNTGIIVGIVAAGLLFIGIIVWISFITVRNKHREMLKEMKSKLISKKELKF